MEDNAQEAGSQVERAIPTWFWVVAVIALLWNLMGLMAFVMQLMITKEAIAALPAEQQPLYENIPIWVTLAFAVATVFGTLGCFGLLMRKSWAFPVFVLSLIGVVVQMGHVFLMTDALKILGPASVVMPAMVAIIGIALILHSKGCIARGWLS